MPERAVTLRIWNPLVMQALPTLIVAALAAVACSTTENTPGSAARVEPTVESAPPAKSEVGPAIQPTEKSPFDLERAENLTVHGARGVTLATEAPGQWVLITRGEVHGPWRDFDSAWSEAQTIAKGALHAFLYRAGLDDVDVEFRLSPFLSSHPRWTQIGYRLGRPMGLTMYAAGDVWSRKVGGKILKAAWGDAGARLTLSDPERRGTAEVRGVRSALFEQDLTITEDAALNLQLGRFEAPGVARYIGRPETCRKVLVRLSIEELEYDVATIAYVLPRSITGPTTLTPAKSPFSIR